MSDRELLRAELGHALSVLRAFDERGSGRDDARRNVLLSQVAAAAGAYLSTFEDIPLEVQLCGAAADRL